MWRSTLEISILRELLADVRWGKLDLLILDLPPGSDHIQNLKDLLGKKSSLLLITLPSLISQKVVERSAQLAQKNGLPILGLIENMKGIVCPGCNKLQDLMQGEGKDLAQACRIPYLGSLPLDPRWSSLADAGRLWDWSRWHPAMQGFFHRLEEAL